MPHRYICNFCNAFRIMLFSVFILVGFLKQHEDYYNEKTATFNLGMTDVSANNLR